MKTIGIRVNPSFVTYAVLDALDSNVVVVDRINVPKALSVPEGLKYIRSTLLDVLREYDVAKAGIRLAEHTLHGPLVERIQIEGVVQEALASSMVKAYFAGQIATISAKAGIARTDFKEIVSGDKYFPDVENWGSHTAEEREAILTAIGARNA